MNRQSNTNESASSRRDFLARTAAAAGAAAVLGARPATAERFTFPVAADRAPLGPDEAIRMGVIGTGGMGTGHCQAIMGLVKGGAEKVQIVALADVCQPRLEAAQKACEEGQGIKVDTYTDYKKLLERKDIHGVLIASTEHWHAQQAIDAILAGKDVYCEKPMTLTLPEAVKLREVVNANRQQVFQVGTQMMQLPKYHEAKKLIASGLIGTPTLSQTSYCRNSKDGEWNYYAIDPNWKPGTNLDWDSWCGPLGKAEWDPKVYARWRRYKKYSTGIIGDLLVHVVTPLMMALDQGWPVHVVASGGHLIDKAMENHDQVMITVEFETGHTMIVAGSTCNEVGLEAVIRGNQGNLYLGGRHCVFRPERIYSEQSEEKTYECADIGNDQDKHRLDWFRCIRSRELPPANVELATKVMVVVDLATRSMWDGKGWRFDPKTMTAKSV